MVQPELERQRSPLVSSPLFRGGIFKALVSCLSTRAGGSTHWSAMSEGLLFTYFQTLELMTENIIIPAFDPEHPFIA